ncbi:Slp/YeaY family lipoprotein [Geoalkalibacter halelectricus]|uniref:Slp/YeaY family lipoprotein n=1 Tax=Geoalkalibacter halelectricus TaxID=2847045 RepID=UPI003D1A6551
MSKILWRVILLLVLSAAVGCTHVLPPEARREVDPYLDLRTVREAVAEHEGSTLLVGGLIVDHAVTREGSRLEILSYTLDRWGRPLRADEQAGRFLAQTERVLDPALYEKGRQVTLTGVVAGEAALPLGEKTYRYPLLRLRAIYLWPRQEAWPDPWLHRPYGHPYYPYHPFHYPYHPYPFGWRYPWW